MQDRKIGRIKFLGYFPVACKPVWGQGDPRGAAENNYARREK
jgi:hypothetical protein